MKNNISFIIVARGTTPQALGKCKELWLPEINLIEKEGILDLHPKESKKLLKKIAVTARLCLCTGYRVYVGTLDIVEWETGVSAFIDKTDKEIKILFKDNEP